MDTDLKTADIAARDVFIIDDDEAVRDSLAVLLEASDYQTKAFESGRAFLKALDADSRGCALLDVRMPDLGGLEVQAALREAGRSISVIIITGHADVPIAVRAMQGGAADFIEKPFDNDVLMSAIDRAFENLQKTRQREELAQFAERGLDRLTPRERDVLEQLVIGNPNKVIAYDLGLSPRTVEIHRSRVMEKMEARNLSHLVRMALAAGFEPPA